MQGHEFVIQINCVDRLGLGYEIFEVFKNQSINMLGMEAKANQAMIVKFEGVEALLLQQLIEELKKIQGVTTVALKDQMPCEQREHELSTILNSVSEGIIAVNRHGQITHINEMASKICHGSQQELVGKDIAEVLSPDIPMLQALKNGRSYHLREVKMRNGRKSFHYLTSGVPILNEKGQIIGAVATIKDFRQVEEIISTVDKRKKPMTTFEDIVHQSSEMRRIIETARVVAKRNSTILLRGESGTGKELFARAIHMESERSLSPFVALNCGALPENLLESELFGYEEGSFTGASKGGKKGLFEQADTGTLFLDEIGEISPQMQVRLLRVLQEGTIRRVGGSSEIPVNVRIIAATHRNLEEMIRNGEFREDLYYRLNIIPLRIPPLREHPEDIPLLAQHLVRKICAKLNKPEICLTKDSVEYLMAQRWPGNVRQLENTIERILNLMGTTGMQNEEFYDWINLEPACKQVGQAGHDCIKIPVHDEWPTLKEIVNEVEKQVLLRVLKNHPSSRKAARVLGVTNTTILNKIKTYGIVSTSNG
ncbi:MAG: sigma 54-interacting transcriptional regulator [Bacillota bacterium]